MQKSILITLIGLLIAGCSSPGILVSRQEGDKPAKVGQVPVDGKYALFIAGQDSPQLGPFPMKAGQPMGFDRGNVAGLTFIYAIFRNRRVPLEVNKTYEWRRLSPDGE